MVTYRIGLILTILGWLVCLNPFFILFAGPIFLIGLLVVWLSKAKLKSKVLTTFIPFILWYPCFLLLMYFGSNHMTPETFLVPKKFRGQITLIYNEPCGQTIQMIDGRLIYKIPDNGVMILSHKFETGYIDQEYYFVDSNWNIIEKIPMLTQQDFNEDYTTVINKNEPPRNNIGMFLLGTGSGATLKNDNYSYHKMEVNSWDSLRVEQYNNQESLIDSLLYQCRQKLK